VSKVFTVQLMSTVTVVVDAENADEARKKVALGINGSDSDFHQPDWTENWDFMYILEGEDE
jgi:hypothetical protein